ncbi:1064_t:CDS:1, partial [Acaulospora morrowiae]
MTLISKNSSNKKTPPSPLRNTSPQTPTINVTPAQEKLDSLLQQESEFIFISPINSPTFPVSAGNNRNLKVPPPVHISTTTAQHEDIPTYEHTKIDMPPSYQTSLKSTSNRKSAPKPLVLNSMETEEPWPITKKLFFLGFFFWPLWFV